MNLRICILLIFTSLTLWATAHEKFTLHTLSAIDKHQAALSTLRASSISTESQEMQAFIILNDGEELPIDKLNKIGVTINSEAGNIFTASIPYDALEKVAEIDAVKTIDAARTVHPLNNLSRAASNVDAIHSGLELANAYKGSGVVVGIVDVGIDFNHINFKDSNGNSRVKIAALYNSTSKAVHTYDTPLNISSLTTDYSASSHGTHVSGIAAGSYSDNNFYGMAPESELVLYGLGENMTDANIINGIKTIFNYADQVGKPAVVNISLGINTGPHDGTYSYNKAIEELTKEGRIVVMAVGNEGNTKIHINKTFTATDKNSVQFATIPEYSDSFYYTGVDAWSHDNKPFGVQFFIYNIITKEEAETSEIYYPTSADSKKYSWTTTKFDGTITSYCGLASENNRYNIYTELNGSCSTSLYRVGLKFYGENGTEVDCWCDSNSILTNQGNTSYTEGDSNSSFNDLTTGNSIITIGAYSTRRSYDAVDGRTYLYSTATLNDIAFFSSYGTDINGRNYPDVVAPGFCVISSVNGYDTTTTDTNGNYLASVITPSGSSRSYHWGDMLGTSMAAPAATGIVALWLQANPDLSPSEVRNIMKETALRDVYMEVSENQVQWGAGKLDAKAGLLKILSSSNSGITDIHLRDNEVLLYPNPSDGNFTIFAKGEDSVKLTIYNTNGAIVHASTENTDNGIVHVSLSGNIAPGIYFVKVTGKSISHTSRIIIK